MIINRFYLYTYKLYDYYVVSNVHLITYIFTYMYSIYLYNSVRIRQC